MKAPGFNPCTCQVPVTTFASNVTCNHYNKALKDLEALKIKSESEKKTLKSILGQKDKKNAELQGKMDEITGRGLQSHNRPQRKSLNKLSVASPAAN